MAIRGAEQAPFGQGVWDQMLEDAIEDALQSEIRKRIDLIARDVVSRRLAGVNSPEAFVPSAELDRAIPSAELGPAAGPELRSAPNSREARPADGFEAFWTSRLEGMLDRRLDEQITRGAFSEFVAGAETAPQARMRSAELLASLTARGSELLAAGVNSPEEPARGPAFGLVRSGEVTPGIAANADLLAQVLGSGKPVIALVSPEMLPGLLSAESAPIAVASPEMLSSLIGGSAEASIAVVSPELIAGGFTGAEAAPFTVPGSEMIPIAIVSPEMLDLDRFTPDRSRFSGAVREALERGGKAEALRLVIKRGLAGIDAKTRESLEGVAFKGELRGGDARIKA